ncbi:MAG TPA: P-II family nitrogen regulator [Cytophagaceae bacterium]|jgi:nitrogen regulatory protein P-II 1|nr:P-II family nitrogen regulator [Cytophagaceae bacterium]
MKKIEAIIRTSHFYQVKDALHKIGIDFFTFEDVKGVGNQKVEKTIYRGVEYDFGSIARTKLTIVITNDRVDSTVECILNSARTGEIGDGKIFVSTVDEVYRIRSGEKDAQAL